jgi:hypothetical protein
VVSENTLKGVRHEIALLDEAIDADTAKIYGSFSGIIDEIEEEIASEKLRDTGSHSNLSL